MPKAGGAIAIEKLEDPGHLAVRLFAFPDWFVYRGVEGSIDRTQRGYAGGERPLWKAPNGWDLDVKDGRVYWNQSPEAGFPGCLGTAKLDGTDGRCLDEGAHTYGGVRVDDTAIYFIRDGDIWRLPRQ